jgi:hypothetical protein
MRASLLKKTFSVVRSGGISLALEALGALLFAATMCLLFTVSAAAREDAPGLPRAAQEQMDSLASRVAEQIRRSKIDPEFPKIFVIDFSNASDKQFSKLGTLLADDLAQSLAEDASGFQVEDRKSFDAYLKENWMALEELQSEAVCLTLARSMGGAGVVRGTIETDANQQLRISLSIDGLGTIWSGDAQFPMTGALQQLLKQPAISYERSPGAIPVEPGILQPGVDGATLPVCVFCPARTIRTWRAQRNTAARWNSR